MTAACPVACGFPQSIASAGGDRRPGGTVLGGPFSAVRPVTSLSAAMRPVTVRQGTVTAGGGPGDGRVPCRVWVLSLSLPPLEGMAGSSGRSLRAVFPVACLVSLCVWCHSYRRDHYTGTRKPRLWPARAARIVASERPYRKRLHNDCTERACTTTVRPYYGVSSQQRGGMRLQECLPCHRAVCDAALAWNGIERGGETAAPLGLFSLQACPGSSCRGA